MHSERCGLATAAFGDGVGDSRLPPPETAQQSWWRAVALGGRGYYARGRAELCRARRLSARNSAGDEPATAEPSIPPPILRSLALSTEASWSRQLGWHRHAAELDGAALALVPGDPEVPLRLDALGDALIGLAADALGVGRLALAARLLDRCADELAAQVNSPDARISLRHAWVSAELAMASGDAPRATRASAAAVRLAAEFGSQRHRVKSALLSAAAMCVAGDVAATRTAAADVARQCRAAGLLPLEWAASMLLAAVVDPDEKGEIDESVRMCAAELGRRGGTLRRT
ncbi:hypothetical protein OG921_12045 [Aldersonia sp. NBC_00410]|uniref:hypothetical protein n=1 Tax=Aldersonia sp. NBC_00410 TaxID=2975954 RepID=UPI002252D4EB|nr:hypothetical protein [Aldersonia sp. NBC_00410]MCX5043898.1 hypothetical protein [Aldersonia sp. NBC_00410]